MSLLEIHIPENWPSPDQEADTLFHWHTRDEQGKPLHSGQSALDAMPLSERCQLVLPASRVLLSSVRPPTQNRKKFMQALPFAVEDRIMADPESIHVAAGETQASGDVPVAIVDRAWLRQVLDRMQHNGLLPIRAESEILLAPWQEGAWSLVWRGTDGFLRQGPFSGIALDGGDATQPPGILQLVLAAAENKPETILIYTDADNTPDLAAWSSSLGIPVEFSRQTVSGAISTKQSINLLQGEFAPGKTRSDWLPRLRPALILVSLLLGVHITFTIADWAMLKYEKYSLTNTMEKTFRTAFPDARTIVNAPLQMRRNLIELRHSAGQLDQNDFLPLLAEVAPLLGKDTHLRRLEYRDGKLDISLTLPNQATAETLRTRLPQVRLKMGNSTPTGLEAELSIGK